MIDAAIVALPLCYKTTLVVFVIAFFYACLCNAIRLFLRDEADSGLAFLLVGVFGLMASIGIGLPYIVGGLP